ncbi:MAG: hypothetical protein KJ698_03435 [Actinobacteria bacterium]|nr:hypothetical protein [Actinomycetota bacterium]MBU1493961.1 hypothetical protein [Actinomycetota bacterium]
MTTPNTPIGSRASIVLRRRDVRIAGWVVLFGAMAAILGWMRVDLALQANTPTGGDMGAHVLIPAYLRDNLLSHGRLIGWSNDWYAGFPMLYFYFPLPAITIVFLDVILPYGVAFKLVTIAGLASMPFSSYYFARSMGLARPVALVGGLSGAMFIFMESFTIFGGNTLSTLAGEYSFSWSFSLSLLYLGVVIRNTREGRGFTVGAGALLALTALSHLITTMVVVVASLPLLFRRKGPGAVIGSWGLGFALAAFWALPVLVRTLGGYTTDMRWHAVSGIENVFPRELWPMVLLAAVGLMWAVARKATVGPLVMLMVVPVAGYYVIEFIDFRKLYNARLLPYWYFSVYLLAGIFIGMAVTALVRRVSARPGSVWAAAAIAGVLVVVGGVAGVQKAPGWARWNFTGYEGKDGWTEYQNLMEELDRLPDGRVMWEANRDLNRYGTPMALMLTGYWTEGHPSMEGLLFESSITTPFHFLNASEVSQAPSNPIPGLDYRRMDFARAEKHLMLYDVAYYVSFTDEATQAATGYGLEVLAETDPFTIYALPDAPLVEVARYLPAVWDGEGSFNEAALGWYDDVDGLDRWLAEDGPAVWPRVSTLDSSTRAPLRATGEVTDIVLEDHRISFTTTAVGVPHLIKVSDFPNWQATGAEGPWRAAPSLMLVIPTEEQVVVDFRNTWVETDGMVITVVTLLTLAGLGYWRRQRRLQAEARAEA